jgi:uncharacterized membrane protein
MTDTGKGALFGSAGAAALGAIIYHGNPLAGALIGAASGALGGTIVGHSSLITGCPHHSAGPEWMCR